MFSIISIVYMFYFRLHALLTPVRIFTLFFFSGGGRGEEGGWGKANKENYERWCANGEWSEIYQPPAKFEHFAKKYSSTTNKFLKATKGQSTQSGSLIRDVCSYSQPRFSKLIHTMGGGRSPDHGSRFIAGRREWIFMASSFLHESRWFFSLRARSLVHAMWDQIPFRCWGLGRHKFSLPADSHKWACSHFLCQPSRWSGLRPCHVRTQRTRDRRLALICISVFILCLVPSFLAVSSLYSASKSLHLIL